MVVSKRILSRASALEKMHRMAIEIAENMDGDDSGVILIGIAHNGLAMAERIKMLLGQYYSAPIDIVSLSMNKDKPENILLSKDIDFDDKNIVLIDDVINTGKTLLYALKPLLHYYPKKIQTLVMIERMHKLFPIKPDYVGLSLATTLQDHIKVVIEDNDVAGVLFA